MEDLNTFQQTLFGIAIISSAILGVQLILTIIGMDSMDGVDTDFDVDADGDVDYDSHTPFQLFTFRNLITFLAVFGWSSLAFYESGYKETPSVLWGVLLGLVSMFVMAGLFYLMHKMKQENIPSLESAIGKNARVYLTIPEKGKGKGKVTIDINGTKRTLNAYSSGKEIPTFAEVKVTKMDGSNLIVEEL